jgi:excisionase family DNA binding protein
MNSTSTFTPDHQDVATAQELAGVFGSDQTLVIRAGDTSVQVGGELLAALVKVTAGFVEGQMVSVLTQDAELTPAQAAKVLGISRPMLQRLINQGRIPSHRLPDSRHQKLRAADVLFFNQQRGNAQKALT